MAVLRAELGASASRGLDRSDPAAMCEQIWETLAAEKPGLFGPLDPADATMEELIALYTLHNRRSELRRWRGSEHERRETARRRRTLAEWTGWPEFEQEREVIVTSPHSLLMNANCRSRGWGGCVYVGHPQLREIIWLDHRFLASCRRDKRGDGPLDLADLICHEEVHCAVARRAPTSASCDSEELQVALDEGLTMLAEACVTSVDSQFETWVDPYMFLAGLIDGCYRTQATSLFGLFGKMPGPGLVSDALEMAVKNARCNSDPESAMVLNIRFAKMLAADQWLDRLGGSV